MAGFAAGLGMCGGLGDSHAGQANMLGIDNANAMKAQTRRRFSTLGDGGGSSYVRAKDVFELIHGLLVLNEGRLCLELIATLQASPMSQKPLAETSTDLQNLLGTLYRAQTHPADDSRTGLNFIKRHMRGHGMVDRLDRTGPYRKFGSSGASDVVSAAPVTRVGSKNHKSGSSAASDLVSAAPMTRVASKSASDVSDESPLSKKSSLRKARRNSREDDGSVQVQGTSDMEPMSGTSSRAEPVSATSPRISWKDHTVPAASQNKQLKITMTNDEEGNSKISDSYEDNVGLSRQESELSLPSNSVETRKLSASWVPAFEEAITPDLLKDGSINADLLHVTNDVEKLLNNSDDVETMPMAVTRLSNEQGFPQKIESNKESETPDDETDDEKLPGAVTPDKQEQHDDPKVAAPIWRNRRSTAFAKDLQTPVNQRVSENSKVTLSMSTSRDSLSEDSLSESEEDLDHLSSDEEDENEDQDAEGGKGAGSSSLDEKTVHKRLRHKKAAFEDVQDQDAAILAKPSHKFILHPNGQWRMMWDIKALILIVLEAITIPLVLSFSIDMPDIWFWYTTTFFSLDFFLNCVTGYFSNGLLVMRQWMILTHYLKTWMILDVCSTFPWEAFFATSSSSSSLLRLTKIGKLLRVLRLLRLAKLKDLFIRIEDMLGGSSAWVVLFSLAKWLVVFSLLCHWCACLWGFIGNPEKIGHSSQFEKPHPLSDCSESGPCEKGMEGSPWLRRYGYDNYGARVQYLAALHFATGLVTGAEIDLQPGYWCEKVFMILMMIVSFLVCSTIISQIVVILHKFNAGSAEFKERMQVFKEFMVSRKVPAVLQAKVKRYLEYEYRNASSGKAANENVDVANKLSPWLRLELMEHLYNKTIMRHPFFESLPQKLMKHVCAEARTVLCAPGDVVVQKGHRASCMCFIVRGKLRVLQAKEGRNRYTMLQRSNATSMRDAFEKSNPSQTVKSVKGDDHKSVYLSYPSWIGDMCLFVDMVRTKTVLSVTHSELLLVQKSTIQNLLVEFPKVVPYYEEFQERVTRRDLVGAGICCSNCHAPGHAMNDCPAAQHALRMAAVMHVFTSNSSSSKDKTGADGKRKGISLQSSTETEADIIEMERQASMNPVQRYLRRTLIRLRSSQQGRSQRGISFGDFFRRLMGRGRHRGPQAPPTLKVGSVVPPAPESRNGGKEEVSLEEGRKISKDAAQGVAPPTTERSRDVMPPDAPAEILVQGWNESRDHSTGAAKALSKDSTFSKERHKDVRAADDEMLELKEMVLDSDAVTSLGQVGDMSPSGYRVRPEV